MLPRFFTKKKTSAPSPITESEAEVLMKRIMCSAVGSSLELRTGCYESLASLVAFVLLEVLDEASGEVLGFLVPLSGISVGVARIEDTSVNAFELCGNLEVEVRNTLCGSLEDSATEDSIDDTTCILDRDALASAVPTGVHQVRGKPVRSKPRM